MNAPKLEPKRTDWKSPRIQKLIQDFSKVSKDMVNSRRAKEAETSKEFVSALKTDAAPTEEEEKHGLLEEK